MKYGKFHAYELMEGFKFNTSVFLIPLLLSFMLNQISMFYIFLIYLWCTGLFFFLCMAKIYSYQKKHIKFGNDFIKIKFGIFANNKIASPTKHIKYIIVKQNLVQKIIGLYKLTISYTKIFCYTKNEFNLRKIQVCELKKSFLHNQSCDFIYKTRLKNLLILSISHYNFLSTTLVIIAILKKAYNKSAKLLYFSVFNQISRFFIQLSMGDSAVFLTIFTVIAVTIHVFKFWDLRIKTNKRIIEIKKGFFTKFTATINKNYIYAVSIKKTFLSFLLKVKFVHIHTGKSKKMKGKLLGAVVPQNESDMLVNNILGQRYQKKCVLVPDKKSLKNYLVLPIISLALSITFFITEAYYKFSHYFSCAVFCYSVWFLLVRIYSHKKSCLILYKNMLCILCNNKLAILESYIPYDKIDKCVVKQSLFQKISKNCNLYIILEGTCKNYFKIKHIKIKNVEKVVEYIENFCHNLKQ